MRFLNYFFFSSILLVATAAPHLNDTSLYGADTSLLHEFSKRAAFCGPRGRGVELRGSKDDTKALNYGNTCRTQSRYPQAYTYNYAKRDVTAKTVLPGDGQVIGLPLNKNYRVPEAKDPWTCDHIIEIQIFGKILGDSQNPKKNSVCDIAASGKYPDWKQRLDKLRNVINEVGNVNFFTTDLEKIKGPATQAFLASNPHALHDIVDARPGERVKVTWGPSAVTGTTDLEWLAFEDYLKKTETRTKGVAVRMDHAIQVNFPGAEAGTAALWQSYMDAVTKVAEISRKRVQRRIEAIECGQQAAKQAQKPGKGLSAPGAKSKSKTKKKPRELFDRLVGLVRRVAGKTKPKAPATDSETPISCPLPPKEDTPPSKPTTPKTAKPKPVHTTPKTTKPTVPKTTKPKSVHTTPKTRVKPKVSSPRPKPKPKVTKPAPKPAPRPKARLPAPRKKTRPRRLDHELDAE